MSAISLLSQLSLALSLDSKEYCGLHFVTRKSRGRVVAGRSESNPHERGLHPVMLSAVEASGRVEVNKSNAGILFYTRVAIIVVY